MENEEKKPPDVPQKLLNTHINTLFFNNFSQISERLKNKLKFNIYHSLEKCEELWRRFSTNESLFDLWEFRYQWYLSYQYTPYFITIEDNVKPIALFPLWFDYRKKRFEWFGSDWMEDNKFLIVDEKLIPHLLKVLPKKTLLNALLKKYEIDNFHFLDDEPKFILPLEKFKSLDDYLAQLPKKTRYNLKRDYFSILKLKPKIVFIDNHGKNEINALKQLSLSIYNGQNKDISDFVEKERVVVFENLATKVSIYKSFFVKIYIQDYLAAIDFLISFNNILYGLKAAYDFQRFPGISSFINLVEIDYAFTQKIKQIDILQGSYNWKNHYYQALPLYKIVI